MPKWITTRIPHQSMVKLRMLAAAMECSQWQVLDQLIAEKHAQVFPVVHLDVAKPSAPAPRATAGFDVVTPAHA